ncbi:MAG: UbiH/UbiF/VisC/COQ6 family ubiquinone biosynthesis hydroxylase [Rhodospirillaceae bacterium]
MATLNECAASYPVPVDNDSSLTTEVAIVGGGLAGLSLACALATAGVPTVCIDRDSPDAQSVAGFDIRTTALALCGQRVLAAAGVWPHMVENAQPINDIRVVDRGSPLHVHYDHQAVGDEPFGYVLDNSAIRAGLFRRVSELAALTHIAPMAVRSIERTTRGAALTLADGRTVRARLIVGADGRVSLTRQSAGIQMPRRSYNQTAIICNIGHEFPHNGLAIEYFTPTGPFAVLPLTKNRSSIVWSERSDRAKLYMALPDDAFTEELKRRVGEHLGEIRVLGGRAAWPLGIMLAERMIDTRLALIGETIHAIHPIAGQGLNLSLRDVAALAEVVVDRFRLGLDIGAPDVLERYQRWRRFDTLLLAGVCDSLVHLFSNDIAPVKIGRQLGLGVVERLPELKRFFMKHAMGLVGQLPRMIRGEAL